MSPMLSFFDRHDRFLQTSHTGADRNRLTSRHEAILGDQSLFAGKRVLDIASHDGRWSLAALRAGAAHVVGVEPRPELVSNARRTFHYYGEGPASHTFVEQDVFAWLTAERPSFDLVLCLGFFYHTIRHAELFDLIERTGAETVIIDTEVTPPADDRGSYDLASERLVHGNPFHVHLLHDLVEEERMAWPDSLTRNGVTIVGRPSRAAVGFLASHFGFSCTEHDWPQQLRGKPDAMAAMNDYVEGWRTTFTCRRTQATTRRSTRDI